jgi:AcrR family transcriptional regulator
MEKTDKKREDILDAAMICLARYGMVKSTLDDVAQILGINKATLYYYYKNKETIFIDAMEREARRFFSIVNEKFKSNTSAADKIRTMVHTYYDYFKDRAEILELNAQAMIDNHAIMQKLHKHLCSKNIHFLSGIIQEGIQTGELKSVDVNRLAGMIRLILDAQQLEMYIAKNEGQIKKLDYDKLEQDSIFIVNIILNSISYENQN